MNINLYKKAMADIVVEKNTIEKLSDKSMKRAKKMREYKLLPVCALFGILLFSMISFTDLLGNKPKITINVYAAEKEIQLTKEPISFKMDASPFMGGSSIDDNGKEDDAFVDYHLKLRCEGDNLKSITYSCNDKKITMDNMRTALVYYIENYDMPVNEYKNKKLNELGDNIIRGCFGAGEKSAHITKLIGSSYSVPYEDQENKQYGIRTSATVDSDGKFYFNDIIIKVDICMKDGSHQNKKLLIKPVKSERGFLPEIQIRIL